MNETEERLCREQGLLFELSADRFLCGSPNFVDRFMHSQIAKKLDRMDPFGLEQASSIIEEMEEAFPGLNKRLGQKYPKAVLHWMGYVYRAWSIISHRPSSSLYKKCKAEKLLELYYVHHTYDIEYCVEELEKMFFPRGKKAKTDYEVYRQILLM